MNNGWAHVFFTTAETDCEPVTNDIPSQHSDISCNCQSFESLSERLDCVSCRMTKIIFAYPANENPIQNTQHRTGILYTTGKRDENSSHTKWPFFNNRKAD